MKNTFYKILVLSVLFSTFTGCGANNDNLDILNSTAIPEINNFTTSTLSTTGFGAGYTASTPYWIFNSGGYGSYLAPARGIVAEIGPSAVIPNTSFVTIIHSGRMATRVHGIQYPSVRSGDAVTLYASVGTFFTTTQIAFQVFLDGTPVCPLSFMSAAFKSSFAVGNYNPCH